MKLKVLSELDTQFQPLALVVREFRKNTKGRKGQDLVIAIERNKGYISAYKTRIYKDGEGKDEVNFRFVERIVKALRRQQDSGRKNKRGLPKRRPARF